MWHLHITFSCFVPLTSRTKPLSKSLNLIPFWPPLKASYSSYKPHPLKYNGASFSVPRKVSEASHLQRYREGKWPEGGVQCWRSNDRTCLWDAGQLQELLKEEEREKKCHIKDYMCILPYLLLWPPRGREGTWTCPNPSKETTKNGDTRNSDSLA